MIRVAKSVQSLLAAIAMLGMALPSRAADCVVNCAITDARLTNLTAGRSDYAIKGECWEVPVSPSNACPADRRRYAISAEWLGDKGGNLAAEVWTSAIGSVGVRTTAKCSANPFLIAKASCTTVTKAFPDTNFTKFENGPFPIAAFGLTPAQRQSLNDQTKAWFNPADALAKMPKPQVLAPDAGKKFASLKYLPFSFQTLHGGTEQPGQIRDFRVEFKSKKPSEASFRPLPGEEPCCYDVTQSLSGLLLTTKGVFYSTAQCQDTDYSFRVCLKNVPDFCSDWRDFGLRCPSTWGPTAAKTPATPSVKPAIKAPLRIPAAARAPSRW
jgi:hypothetical protein